ncbi:hypothetical protein [Mycobacterium sp. ZZG]
MGQNSSEPATAKTLSPPSAAATWSGRSTVTRTPRIPYGAPTNSAVPIHSATVIS